MKHTAILLVVLLAPACISQDHSVADLLTPDQLHVFYSDGSADSSGSIVRSQKASGFDSRSSADYSAWSAGLSWDLFGPGPGSEQRALADAVRAMRRAVASVAELPPEGPVDVRLSPSVLALLADLSRERPVDGRETEGKHSLGAAGDTDACEPPGPPQEDPWTTRLVAAGALLTALGAFLGRHRIPGVRNLTKRARKERALADTEDC